MRNFRYAIIALFMLCLTAFAAEPTIETIGPFTGSAPDTIKSALADQGYRVTLDGKIVAEVWPAKTPVTEKNSSATAIYPDFGTGQFYGVISMPIGGGDFRGQNIPAGTYTMRYELLPSDGNHLGVSPDPDFFLLVPAADDPGPATKLNFQALVRASAKASGTAHPAAFALAPTDASAPKVSRTEQGYVIANFPIASKQIGMILSGSAEQ